jgi:hypothetical protein
MSKYRALFLSVFVLLGVSACGSSTSVSKPAVATDATGGEATVATEETTSTEATEATTDVAETVAVETTAAPISAAELASVGKSGFSTWTLSNGEIWANGGALITNNSNEDLFMVSVTYNFIGADGIPVTTETDTIEVIPAGSSYPSVIDVYSDLAAAMPVTLEITVFADADSFFKSQWVEMGMGATKITPDEYFPTVNGSVTNPATQPFDFYRLSCLLLDAAGTVVGGAFTYPDQTAPGQTIAWQASIEEGPMEAGAASAECRSIATFS